MGPKDILENSFLLTESHLVLSALYVVLCYLLVEEPAVGLIISQHLVEVMRMALGMRGTFSC